jgi:hypothetical protein
MMRTAAVAAVLGLAASWGCSDPGRADLAVQWTFGGVSCDQAGIATIHVEIAGELLTPSDFACKEPGGIVTGAQLGRFLYGNYSITVIGYDAAGAEVGRASQSFTVHSGKNVVDVDVPLPPEGSVTLTWDFAGQNCAQAGISSVRVDTDGFIIFNQNGAIDLPCTEAGVDGIHLSGMTPGPHVFDVVALRGSTPSFYLQDVTATVVASQDTPLPVSLQAGPVPAPIADVYWSFAGGIYGGMFCDEAQVDTVRLYLDPAGNGSGGTLVGEFPCTQNQVDGVSVTNLSVGTHTFAATGLRSGRIVYQSLRSAGNQFFVAGLHASVDLNVDAIGSGTGSATLQWDFSAVGGACQGTINWKLIDPTGGTQSGTASCSSSTGLLVPSGSIAGVWEIAASATASGSPVSAVFLFGVPNAASAPPVAISFSK